VNVLYG